MYINTIVESEDQKLLKKVLDIYIRLCSFAWKKSNMMLLSLIFISKLLVAFRRGMSLRFVGLKCFLFIFSVVMLF